VAIAASGNYIAGAIWPPVVQLMIEHVGWRTTYASAAALCVVAMIPLALTLRRRAPDHETGHAAAVAHRSLATLGLSPNALQALLIVAGLSCCVAMSMPQVHIVAYCADLGYGVARGAEMLSLMLGFGIVSRVATGWLADKVGGAMTLLLGSTLQCVALVFYLVSDSLISLYLASALFGLFQGGIVPSYAIIVREYFPAREAATRVGLTVSSTIVGMALGGWMGGVLFDLTGSYRAAFINGIAWNVLNAGVAWWLLSRQNRPMPPAAA
jgi:predicted MFS family arabinose efflux permease